MYTYNYYKKNFTFFLKIVTFTIKTKKIFNIGDTDVNKILVSKKNHVAQMKIKIKIQ